MQETTHVNKYLYDVLHACKRSPEGPRHARI